MEKLLYSDGTFPGDSSSLLNNLKNVFSDDPELVMGDGDGTVNIRSLRACLKWTGEQNQSVHHEVFPGVNHSDMLKTDETVQYFVDIISSINNQQ